jgi:chromosome segregation ATPase
MAKQKIEKADVAKAIEALRAAGKNPTIQAIRAALGDQGSLTTIQQFKKELADEKLNAQDSPQALDSFRAIWASAVAEGRSQRDEEIRDLQETLTALSSEAEKLDGQAMALRAQTDDATRKYQEIAAKETALKDELAKARETAERNATKLVEVLERHQKELGELRVQVSEANSRAHGFELELAAARAKLEVTAGAR